MAPPPAGSGTLVVRALFKQGDTNGGAFYWAGGAGGGPPTPGAAGGDLKLPDVKLPGGLPKLPDLPGLPGQKKGPPSGFDE